MIRKIIIYLTLLFCSGLILGQVGNSFSKNHAGIHRIVVEDVLQTKNYTYLYVLENDEHKWLALPKLDAFPGETYYYQDGYEMVDFKSTELERTFESVWFLGGVISQDDFGNKTPDTMAQQPPGADKAEVPREEMNHEPFEGGITIKELFGNPGQYTGKIVKIKGRVTKFSDGIMGRNWIHMQDGTDFEGKYDLVVTTAESTQDGSVIVVEGKVSVDKDFGYGYFYEIIVEEARINP